MIEEQPNALTLTRVWIRSNIITTVLGVFILISLLVHLATILALLRVRDIVRLQLESAAAQVAEAHQQQIHYDFPIKQSLPFSTTISINETLEVPIQESFPIKQTFNLPIDIAGNTFTLPIPIDTTIPISTTVQVPINRDIPFATTINVDTTVPLDLDLSQPPLGNLLERVEQSLRDLLAKL